MSEKKKQSIRAIPENRGLASIAAALRSARSGMNKIPLPEALGGGVGNLLLGEAPEEIADWSIGFSPFKENPSASRIPIEIRPGREQRVIDTAFLPVAEAYGLAKLAGAGARHGIKKALSGDTQQGRREFLKKAGQAAAGTAAIASTPDLVKSVGKELAPTAAKTAVKTASPKMFMKTVSDIFNSSYRKAYDIVDKMGDDDLLKFHRENNMLPENAMNNPAQLDEYLSYGDIGGYSKAQDDAGNVLQEKIELEEISKLLEDPRFAPYKDYIEDIGPEALDWQREAAMKEMEKIYKTTKKASGGTIENTTHDRKII
jgi:hypothetical protein